MTKQYDNMFLFNHHDFVNLQTYWTVMTWCTNETRYYQIGLNCPRYISNNVCNLYDTNIWDYFHFIQISTNHLHSKSNTLVIKTSCFVS
jgi:hypothetical protein